MAFLETPTFPETIAFGATGGPTYSTHVVQTFDGAEQRNQRWRYPRYAYQLGLAIHTAADTQALYAFFHAIAQGQRHAFRFPDFGAGESTGTDEPIGTGTGAVATYQLVKRYQAGMLTFDRPITKPRATGFVLKVAGTPTGSYNLDTTTGLVTATVTTGQAITATFQFDVPVRFTSDRLAIRRVQGGYQWESIELIEVRDLA